MLYSVYCTTLYERCIVSSCTAVYGMNIVVVSFCTAPAPYCIIFYCPAVQDYVLLHCMYSGVMVLYLSCIVLPCTISLPISSRTTNPPSPLPSCPFVIQIQIQEPRMANTKKKGSPRFYPQIGMHTAKAPVSGNIPPSTSRHLVS